VFQTESYNSKRAAQNAIGMVKQDAGGADVHDKT
jgi:uncharacterized protein YegP (UPF0339 family)